MTGRSFFSGGKVRKTDGVKVYKDPEELARAAAELFADTVSGAVSTRGYASVVLSGGSTPERLFNKLSGPEWKGRVDWQKVHLFWGDERCVPPESTESNFGLAQRTLLSKLEIPLENVHRIRGELPPERAASEYEEEIERFFKDRGAGGPAFDLVFLGLGTDGHTLSVFPGTEGEVQTGLVRPVYVDKPGSPRVTMTPALVNRARRVVFLVSGGSKAGVLAEVVSGGGEYPAGLINPAEGRLIWMADEEAARGL